MEIEDRDETVKMFLKEKSGLKNWLTLYTKNNVHKLYSAYNHVAYELILWYVEIALL